MPEYDDPAHIKAEVEAAAAAELEAMPEPKTPPAVATPQGVAGTDITEEEIEAASWLNQVGDAALLVRLLNGKFVHDNTEDRTFRFNSTHWYPDSNCDFRRAMFGLADLYAAIGAKYAKLFTETDDKSFQMRRDRYNERASKCRSLQRMNSVWRIATSGDGSLGISGDEWNRHPTLLPCANGVVDLETGKLHPGDPRQYFCHASPYPWESLHCEAQLWDDILDKALCRNRDLMDYFNYFAGFACTGIQTKNFFCALGPGGNNGKSVIFDTMGRVLGGFTGIIPVELLLEQKFTKPADGPSPAVLKLRGLRLAVTSEAQRSHRFSLAKIKQLTGQDALEARGLYGKITIEFEQTHTLVLHSNYLPTAAGNDTAFYDRLRVLKFAAKFIPADTGDEDPGRNIWHQIPRTRLNAELAKCGPGILAWYVRCAIRALKLGDMPAAPACVMEETGEYRDEQDLVGQWLAMCTVVDADNQEQMKDLHAAFTRFCVEEMNTPKDKVMSMKSLAADFKNRPGLEKIVSRVIYYRGLRILDEWREGQQHNF